MGYPTTTQIELGTSCATDLLRAGGSNGATSVLKLAHFAELLGTGVELYSHDGLGGHVSVQLPCAIANTQYYGHLANADTIKAGVTHGSHGRELGIENAPEIEDGRLRPSQEPGWGTVIDWAPRRQAHFRGDLSDHCGSSRMLRRRPLPDGGWSRSRGQAPAVAASASASSDSRREPA
jgi:hypothetical protein